MIQGHCNMILAGLVTTACYLVWVSFLLTGGTAAGQSWWLTHFATYCFPHDTNGGMLILVVAIPTILSGSVCTLLLVVGTGTVVTRERDHSIASPASQRSHGIAASTLWLWRLFHDPDTFAVTCVLLPMSIYLASNIFRHLREDVSSSTIATVQQQQSLTNVTNQTTSADGFTATPATSSTVLLLLVNNYKKLSGVANAFGMAAAMSISIMLIPVARHSSIMRVVTWWDPVQAIRLHWWVGWFAIAAILGHVVMYLTMWTYVLGERPWSLIVPPGSCWDSNYYNNSKDDSMANPPVQHTCRNTQTNCTCYAHFRNLAGFLAALAVGIIAVSSLDCVRRRFYDTFYRIHLGLGPTLFFVLCIHCNRFILYLGGPLLYYLATTIPVWLETYKSNVAINTIERIPCSQCDDVDNNNPATTIVHRHDVISLTLHASETAMARYRAGQYVQLSLMTTSPRQSLPSISHPFTINMVPNQELQLRILFRVTGPFTCQLANVLVSASNDDSKKDKSQKLQHLPFRLCIDGFHGRPDRVDQILQRDVVVILAGGIGITPYLSLLYQVVAALASSNGLGPYKTERIVLHWVCRDENLIRYVHDSYFNALLTEETATPRSWAFQVELVIHHTTKSQGRAYQSTMFPNAGVGIARTDHDRIEDEHGLNTPDLGISSAPLRQCPRQCHPFTPSRFATGSRIRCRANLPAFLSFTSITWVGLLLVWACYEHLQSDKQALSRAYGPLIVLAWSVVVAVAVVQFIWTKDDEQDISSLLKPGWTPVAADGDRDDATNGQELTLGANSGMTRSSSGALPTMSLLSYPPSIDKGAAAPLDSVESGSPPTGGGSLVSTPTSGNAGVRIVHREGRPNIHHELLVGLSVAVDAAVMVSGPEPLYQEVRSALHGRSGSLCPAGQQVLFIEERFHK